MTTRPQRLISISLQLPGVVVAVSLLIGTPGKVAAEAAPALTPEEAVRAQAIIIGWLECIDCRDKELENVTRLGTMAVPSLIASLRQGPSDAHRENMRRHLTTLYSLLMNANDKQAARQPTMTETAYVDHHLKGHLNHYRSRAAIALGQIGGPDAKAALQEALRENYPPSVNTVVVHSLKRMESDR